MDSEYIPSEEAPDQSDVPGARLNGAAAAHLLTPQSSPTSFADWWGLGYTRLLPVIPATVTEVKNAGKRPGVRGTDGWYGVKSSAFEATPDLCSTWQSMGAAVGLRFDVDHVGIDIDTLNPTLAEKIERVAVEMFGPSPCRVGRAPKRLLLYRVPDGAEIGYQQVRFDDGTDKGGLLELLAGSYKWAVFQGTHPETQRPYTWTGMVPPSSELSIINGEQLAAFFDRLSGFLPAYRGKSASSALDRAKVDQASLRGDVEMVRSAVRAIPNRYENWNYDDWCKLAAAVRGACPDDFDAGLEIFEEFSDRTDIIFGSDPNDPLATSKRILPEDMYRSVKEPFAVGADWIFKEARKHGWYGDAEPWLEDASEPSPFPVEVSNQISASATPKRFPIISLDEAANSALTDSAEPLVDGLLDQGAMTVLYGESNSGKTFVAMGLAHAIATGRPWGGMTTTKGRVAYIVAEGGRGARKRASALKIKHGSADGFGLILRPVNLLHAETDVGPLTAELKEFGPILIVVDTLSRAMAGGDENSSVDMGSLVKNLDRLRDATGAHVLVVHHTGKNLSKGARGHSLLRAATDTEIEIADGIIQVTKQRDLEGGWSSCFVIEGVLLGLNARDQVVTSAVARLVEAGNVEAVHLEERDTAVLDGLAALDGLGRGGRAGVTIPALLAHFVDREDKLSERNTLRSRLRSLKRRGLAVEVGDGRWLVKPKKVVTAPDHPELADNLTWPRPVKVAETNPFT